MSVPVQQKMENLLFHPICYWVRVLSLPDIVVNDDDDVI